MWTLALIALVSPADEFVYQNEELGVELRLDGNWNAEEAAVPTGKQVVLTLPEEHRVKLSLRAFPKKMIGGGAEDLRGMVEQTVVGDKFEELSTYEVELLGESRPGLSVISRQSEPATYVEHVYLAHGSQLFILESFIQNDAREDFAGLEPWANLTLVAAVEAAPDPLEVMAAKCGTEIEWAETWDEAARRAKARNCPIFVHANIYPGFEISDDAMVTEYTDPHVIELMRQRYVPYKLKRATDVPFMDHDLYGLSGSTFGATQLIATPDGEVLAEDIGPLYTFLVRGLTLDENLPGPKYEPGERISSVRRRLARGEHDQARRDLRKMPELLSLVGELAYRERDAAAAVAAYSAIEGIHRMPEAVDLALAHLRLGDKQAGRLALDTYLEESNERERVPEALYWRASSVAEDDFEAGSALLTELTETHPESRWAWRAAGDLTSTAFAFGEAGKLEWPSDLDLTLALPFEPATETVTLEEAEESAIQFLLSVQQPNGSFSHAGSDTAKQDELRIASTAICASALMAYRDRPEVEAAVRKAIAALLADYALIQEEGERVFFMDYSVWSRPYAIAMLADAIDAGLVDRDDVQDVVTSMIGDLERKQRSNGGWSYYMTGSTDGAQAPEQSISFTTAAAVLGLVRGTHAGFPVPAPVIDAALDCLEAMRDDAGNYEYFLWEHGQQSGNNLEPGAAGRGPVCELALLFGGRHEDLDRVRRALSVFVQHRHGLMGEQGKALMHCGAETQGSHYLCFDYAAAARALSLLPEGERVKYREQVVDALLSARASHGGFVDNPILGPATGTGLALHALQALIDSPR